MMQWLSSDVYAMAQPPGGSAEGGGFMASLPFLLMMIAVMYFLVIRPQKKQADDHKKFLAALQKGHEVVTSSGIFGKVAGIAEQMITLEIAPNVKIKVLRSHVHKAPAVDNQLTSTPAATVAADGK